MTAGIDPAHVRELADDTWLDDLNALADQHAGNGNQPAMPIPAAVDDANMAVAFGQTIDGRYLYCPALGGWHRWDGCRWRLDDTETVYETARRWVLALGAHLFRSDADNSMIKRVAAYRAKSKIDALVITTRRLENIAADVDEFDRHPLLLNCANGVVDLRTGELRPADPGLRLTKCTNVAYRPDALHPDVDTVLEVADPPVRDWLQALFGYAATGHVSEDVMAVFDGSGSNGKTTLLGAASVALGEYGRTASPRLLMKGSHDEHPAIFADLFGRRLVTIEETAEGGALRVETMKALTGGSEINARFMRQNPFTFDPTHKLVAATNHRPAVNSTDHATWRRLRLVPFPYRYAKPDEARPGDRIIDKGLRDRLRSGRHQREAMLAWIVAGAACWARDGLGDCVEISIATDEWRQAEDVIYRFAADRCVLAPGCSVPSAELHREYVRWCETEGRPPSSNKELTKRIESHDIAAAHGVEVRRTERGSVWFGLGLKEWP